MKKMLAVIKFILVMLGRLILMGGIFTTTQALNNSNKNLSKDFNGEVKSAYDLYKPWDNQ